MTTQYQPNAANQYEQIVTGTEIVEPQFDPLGNLLHDDQNTYTWDSDIHLLSVTSKPNQDSGVKNQESRSDFRYDALHRRVSRHESHTQTTTLFVMDGWNVVSEFSFSLSRRFSKSPSLRLTWGEDVSGSHQGAGGIGGLLSTRNDEHRITNWMHYDSNGNVIALSDARGNKSAHYRYDAFGETILAWGPSAGSNPYRFSTKPIEKTNRLVFYGFRYYLPSFGRWLSTDPLGEDGGANLLVSCFNNPVNVLDIMGLYSPKKLGGPDLSVSFSAGSVAWTWAMGSGSVVFTDTGASGSASAQERNIFHPPWSSGNTTGTISADTTVSCSQATTGTCGSSSGGGNISFAPLRKTPSATSGGVSAAIDMKAEVDPANPRKGKISADIAVAWIDTLAISYSAFGITVTPSGGINSKDGTTIEYECVP